MMEVQNFKDWNAQREMGEELLRSSAKEVDEWKNFETQEPGKPKSGVRRYMFTSESWRKRYQLPPLSKEQVKEAIIFFDYLKLSGQEPPQHIDEAMKVINDRMARSQQQRSLEPLCPGSVPLGVGAASGPNSSKNQPS